MALPLSAAKAAKTMPAGKGTYGSKKGRPAKKAATKKSNPFAKKPAAKKPAADKKAAGSKKVPPAFLKNIKKKKGSTKK